RVRRDARPAGSRRTRRWAAPVPPQPADMPQTESAESTMQPPAAWALLIYTVPADPSRKRAYVWRELKKVGAVYLRDGVCVLPQGEGTAAGFRIIAAKIEEFEGEATLIERAQLDSARAEGIMAASRQARADEYGEITREAEGFL